MMMTQQMSKHSQTSVKNVTYDETEKTNRNNDKNQNNRRFFVEFFDAIMDSILLRVSVR